MRPLYVPSEVAQRVGHADPALGALEQGVDLRVCEWCLGDWLVAVDLAGG